MTTNYPDSPVATGFGGDVGSSSTGASAGPKDQAKQAAGTAADEGKHVAGVAQGEAQKVAAEAKSQVHSLLNQATAQVEDQSRTQRDRLVETLRSFADDLQKMAGQSEGGPASGLAQEAADRVHALSSRLDGREPRDLLDDVRSFARRKPGTFLLGALAAGVVAGRVTRGAKDAQNGAPASGAAPIGHTPQFAAPAPPVHGTAAGTPLAGTGYPESEPVYPAGSQVTPPRATGLPNPAGSVAEDASWTDTRSRGDLA